MVVTISTLVRPRPSRARPSLDKRSVSLLRVGRVFCAVRSRSRRRKAWHTHVSFFSYHYPPKTMYALWHLCAYAYTITCSTSVWHVWVIVEEPLFDVSHCVDRANAGIFEIQTQQGCEHRGTDTTPENLVLICVTNGTIVCAHCIAVVLDEPGFDASDSGC